MKNKEKIMTALLSSSSQAEAAEKCGITDRTIRTYLDDPGFYSEYRRRKSELVTDAARQIQASYTAAINALNGIVSSQLAPDGVKISAARALLEYGLKFTEQADVITRLENLEKRLEEKAK